MRDLLAGVNPNSDATRSMISAWRLAIVRYGDCIGNPCGDFTIEPKVWIAVMASDQSSYAAQYAASAARSSGVSRRSLTRSAARRSHSAFATAPSSGGQSGTKGAGIGSSALSGRLPGLPVMALMWVGTGLRPRIVCVLFQEDSEKVAVLELAL